MAAWSDHFASAPPRVRLVKAFATPMRNTVATARTCYSSKGIVEDADVGGPEKYAPLAASIYEAGHHTTYQHAHFQFAIENVSRQFLWSFLHAHPFYNSEQVSQRYVAVKAESLVVPKLDGEAASIYRKAAERQFEDYRKLCALLEAPAAGAFHQRFRPSARMEKPHRRAIGKKAQEIARYVLPVGTTAYLYHTISAVVLFRYLRMANSGDCPAETRAIVEEMAAQVLAHDPEYEVMLQGPLDAGAAPEDSYLSNQPEVLDGARAAAFRAEFDASLDGRVSRLVDWSASAESTVADSVRQVLGLSKGDLGDADAIALAMDPARNALMGESLNLSTMAKLPRAMHHAHYTFRRKLSHAADSQDQRHRMAPGSRPVLAAHVDGEPDVVVPELLRHAPEAMAVFEESVAAAWEAMAKLRRLGVPPEHALYLLPNAASVRFTESSDLLNLHHKHRMRLCYNAQEEIWRASVDEAAQIRERHPLLGRYLLPPCTLRAMASIKPICPEGTRYCGVMVWKKDLAEYERVI